MIFPACQHWVLPAITMIASATNMKKAAPGSVELSVLFPVKNHHHWSNSWLSDKLSIYLSIYIYRYNDSSALVTSTASIPPRIMVIQCDSTSTRFCSLFAVETTINQHISTLPQHFPELPTNLWKMWLCLKGVARCDFFRPLSPDISPSYPLVKRLHNYGKSPCYSWEKLTINGHFSIANR